MKRLCHRAHRTTQALSSALPSLRRHRRATNLGPEEEDEEGMDGKRIVDALLTDLRTLSTEAKKKHNHVKEAAESGVVKVRNISTASTDTALLQNLRAASSEIVHPLVVACSTRNTRLVQIALSTIQRLVQHRILEEKCAGTVVAELWSLVEAECEELRVLQTLTPLVSTETVVIGPTLAKCIVMCFKLRHARDPIVINAASAAVRQIASCVFERVIQEDGTKSGPLSVIDGPTGGGQAGDLTAVQSRVPPTSLRPCAADAYMLFKDLCLLVDGDPAVWLLGLHEISRTLGIELLESLMHAYPGVFFKHEELTRLLRDVFCPLVIRLFSPHLKGTVLGTLTSSTALDKARAIAGQGGHPSDRAHFPVTMRLVRVITVLVVYYHEKLIAECEMFLSQLLRFLEGDKGAPWQRAIALEALHRILAQPAVVRWLCANYDARLVSPTGGVLRSLCSAVASYVRVTFVRSQMSGDSSDDDSETGQSVGLPGFCIAGGSTWMPLVEGLTPKKAMVLEALDKMDPVPLPEGYGISRAFQCTIDATHTLLVAVDEMLHRKRLSSSAEPSPEGSPQNGHGPSPIDPLAVSVYECMQPSLLTAIVMMLDTSTDETMAEALLGSLATLTLLACKLRLPKARHAHLYALASAALPACPGGYVARTMGVPPPEELVMDGAFEPSTSNGTTGGGGGETHVFHQVMATGIPCPTPLTPPALASTPLMLTTKNVQAARVLLTSGQSNVREWGESWSLLLAACAHISWLLAMRPSLAGGGTFVSGGRNDGDAFSSNASSNGSGERAPVMVTTAAAGSDIPIVADMLDKLIVSTRDLDATSLHHVVAALARLSAEAMAVSMGGREPSVFGVAKLLHVGMSNMERIDVVWSELTRHLIEVCGHSHAPLREWATLSLTALVRTAMKANKKGEEGKHQSMVLVPLAALSRVPIADVRNRQIECLWSVLQSHGAQLRPELWVTVIGILADVVSEDAGLTSAAVKQSYTALHLIATDFIQALPIPCVRLLVEADALYGRQLADQNISLSALTQLWTISDYVFRRRPQMGEDASEDIWLVLYTCLSELCVDPRPAVRKSACVTLLQTVASHGHALRVPTWNHMVWQILMPMLDKVRTSTRNASKEREDSGAMLVHHSRDTQAKQWTETAIQTLQGAVRIFNAQRGVLLKMEDFGSAWRRLLSYLEWGAEEENAELSLAAIKCVHEVLLGKAGAQTLDINTTDRRHSTPREPSAAPHEDYIPPLTPQLWMESWKSWIRMAHALVRTPASSTEKGVKPYTPGPSHLTTLLHVFVPLFDRVKRDLDIAELKEGGVLSLMEAMARARVPLEQAPFVVPSASTQLLPTQEAILEAVRAIYQDESTDAPQPSHLRPALPDLIRFLLRMSGFANTPPREGHLLPGKDYAEWARTNLLPFAEVSMRMAVDYYTATAAFNECINARVAVDVVQWLGVPMALKYTCLSPSTWKLAAHGLVTTLRVALPIARTRVDQFAHLWPAIVEAFDRFLFTTNVNVRLSPDDRHRDEFIDCQLIDLLRTDVLPYAAQLPPDFIAAIIALLNRGSISQMDSTDVLASDAFAQRADLARACFDALLSITKEGTSEGSRGVSSSSLGTAAICSLVERCKGVFGTFVRDSRSGGDLRVPRARVVEVVAALRAVDALIDRLAQKSDAAKSDLYSQLVQLYPAVVGLVPSAHHDSEVQSSLSATLTAYQTLMFLQTLPVRTE